MTKGQPWARQKASSPGSSPFRSMLAAWHTAWGARRYASIRRWNARSSAGCPVPLRQPTPSTRLGGMRCSACPACRPAVMRMWQLSAGAGSTPWGQGPCKGRSLHSPTGSPSSSRPETSLIFSGLPMARPWPLAQVSTANSPRPSVAVVITGTAPSPRPSSRAKALAPPMWPETRGMAKRPFSSRQSTAGSWALCRRWGATARTAMPAAPTKTRAWHWEKACAVHWAKGTPCRPPRRVLHCQPACSSTAWARSAKAMPRLVKAISPALTGSFPGGTRW